MYLLIYILLFIFSLAEVIKGSSSKTAFRIMFALMSAMFIFRYGQGTDYFNYIWIYNVIHEETTYSVLGVFYRPDMGYNLLIYISTLFDLGPILFVVVLSIFISYLLYLFFSRHGKYSIVSLFVFYSGYFLIYQFSAIRQGLVIAVLLGLLIPLLFKRKYKLYSVAVLLCSTIHLSAIILIFIPFLVNFSPSKKTIYYLLIIAIVLMFLNVDLYFILSKISLFSRLEAYSTDGLSSNSMFAKVLRVILMIPILLVPQKVYINNKTLNVVKNILLASFFIYVAFASSEIASSRLSAYYRIFEVLFIILIFKEQKLYKTKRYIGTFYISVYAVIYLHNINGFIDQGSYKNTTVFSYPYISVFEDRDKINIYRTSIDYRAIDVY